jgi:hypothetical protein
LELLKHTQLTKAKWQLPHYPRQKSMSVLWYWQMKSVIQVQMSYHREFGEQGLGRQSIKQWLEQFRDTGSVLRQMDASGPSVDPETV